MTFFACFLAAAVVVMVACVGVECEVALVAWAAECHLDLRSSSLFECMIIVLVEADGCGLLASSIPFGSFSFLLPFIVHRNLPT